MQYMSIRSAILSKIDKIYWKTLEPPLALQSLKVITLMTTNKWLGFPILQKATLNNFGKVGLYLGAAATSLEWLTHVNFYAPNFALFTFVGLKSSWESILCWCKKLLQSFSAKYYHHWTNHKWAFFQHYHFVTALCLPRTKSILYVTKLSSYLRCAFTAPTKMFLINL